MSPGEVLAQGASLATTPIGFEAPVANGEPATWAMVPASKTVRLLLKRLVTRSRFRAWS